MPFPFHRNAVYPFQKIRLAKTLFKRGYQINRSIVRGCGVDREKYDVVRDVERAVQIGAIVPVLFSRE